MHFYFLYHLLEWIVLTVKLLFHFTVIQLSFSVEKEMSLMHLMMCVSHHTLRTDFVIFVKIPHLKYSGFFFWINGERRLPEHQQGILFLKKNSNILICF